MNHRQRFLNTMHYQSVDRAPLYDFNFWDETLPLWHEQGLPKTVNQQNAYEYFGLDASLGGGEPPNWNSDIQSGLYPHFPHKVIEDKGETQIILDHDGTIVEAPKEGCLSIPMHVGHTLVDRDTWNKHYTPKLNPDTPGRFPDNFDQRVKHWADPNREHPVFHNAGSLFGWLRNWMGLENVAMVPYDDPAWFEEMVATLADLQIGLLEELFAAGAKFDACHFWEDMCFNAGPMLTPEHFKQFLVPQYKRITSLLNANGCDIVWVDCDGLIDHLLPLWIESGVNCMFPIEVGTWNADPIAYRKQYGKDLLLMGGYNKRILAQSQEAITQEINRLAPLIEQGGFIGFCDHRVPPDVPLENYLHYCHEVRKHWANNTDLPTMHAMDS